MNVSIFYLYIYLQLTDGLQADVCARRVSVTSRLGSGRLDLFRPLGPSISFRALYTAALSIGILHY